MVVQLKFFAGLRSYLPPEPFPYPYDAQEGATVAQVLGALSIPLDKPRIILINGRHGELETALSEGDLLSLFPPVAGG